MMIHKISNKGESTVLSVEEFQIDIKDKFVFLDLSKKLSLRMDSVPTIIEVLKEGFKVSTIESKYQRVWIGGISNYGENGNNSTYQIWE